MPRTRIAAANPREEYLRLEHRLVLLGWLNSLFGYEHNRDLFGDLVDAGEGWDSSGRSHVVNRLLSRGDLCMLKETELPLAIVSKKCGFSLPNHLCTLFKAQFGLTMSDYRRREKGGSGSVSEV